MIEQGEIEEHPAYEDFLSALSYEQNVKDLLKVIARGQEDGAVHDMHRKVR